jgi:hypothetical protein
VLLAHDLSGEPEHAADGDGLALVEKLQKIDDPLENHLEREGGDGQVQVLEPQGRQPHDGAERLPQRHPTPDHQRPPVGDQHVVVAQDPGETGQGVGPHPHEGGVADGDQPGEPRQQVQAVDGHDGDEDVVDHQHVLVADREK